VARVKWIEDRTMYGIDDMGRGVLISASSDEPGISPMQMLLLGIGGCALIDLVLILKKQRQPFEDVDVVLSGTRGEGTPSPWRTMHLHFMIRGDGLDGVKAARAVQLSVEKYCSAYETLKHGVDITYDFEILEPFAEAAD
jgi:putative redox protein